MRIDIVIASVSRAALLTRTVDRLADQHRPADGVHVVATCEADVAGIDAARGEPNVLFSDRGLCKQRNRALDELAGKTDVIVFLDDDFVPHNGFLAEVEEVLSDPQVVGVTGELIDDGIHGEEIPFDAAAVRLDALALPDDAWLRPRSALYGCNMAIRMAAAKGLRFDEALPLYGWQEDIDFTHQLAARGRLVSGPRITGIHLGTRGGRTPGKRLGYSQVANLVHLWRKGTMQAGLGQRLLLQNVLSNAARSLFPEPHIDRRGRLAGNLLALADWARGTIDPRRVERL